MWITFKEEITSIMGIRIKYPDGQEEFLPTAVGEKKAHNGDLVFVDQEGKVVKVVKDEEGLTFWSTNE